jgi:hypothetical protein
MERFKGLEEAEVPDSPVRSADELMKGYTGERGTRFKKGGKVGKVMGEFKSGALKSSSGQNVTNRKQAMAIAMSEAGKSKMKKFAEGGNVEKMAGGGMFGTKAAAAGAARGYGAAKAAMDSMRGAGTGLGNIGNAAMGALRGMGGGNPTLAGMYGAAKGGTGLGNIGNAVMAAKGAFGMKKGGKVPKAMASSAGEDASYVKKEMAFMQKKGAPKSMLKHEKSEMDAGGMKKMAKGGGIEKKGYGAVQKFAKGGSIDGCAVRGKTRAKGRK